MAVIDMVMKGLEHCKNHDGTTCPECPYFHDDCVAKLCADALELLKSQQAEIERLKAGQPKKGHWEERKRQRTYTGTPYIKYRCSVCGEWVDKYENSEFCPFCGADMRGEQDEKGNH